MSAFGPGVGVNGPASGALGPGEAERRLTGRLTDPERRQQGRERAQREIAADRAGVERVMGFAVRRYTDVNRVADRQAEDVKAARAALEGIGPVKQSAAQLYRAQVLLREQLARLDQLEADEANAYNGLVPQARQGLTRPKLDASGALRRKITGLIEGIDGSEPLIEKAERRERRLTEGRAARRAELAEQYPSLRNDRPSMGEGPSIPVTRRSGEWD